MNDRNDQPQLPALPPAKLTPGPCLSINLPAMHLSAPGCTYLRVIAGQKMITVPPGGFRTGLIYGCRARFEGEQTLPNPRAESADLQVRISDFELRPSFGFQFLVGLPENL
jgi:hypothetical protein